jgi:hypothetical protein
MQADAKQAIRLHLGRIVGTWIENVWLVRAYPDDKRSLSERKNIATLPSHDDLYMVFVQPCEPGFSVVRVGICLQGAPGILSSGSWDVKHIQKWQSSARWSPFGESMAKSA